MHLHQLGSSSGRRKNMGLLSALDYFGSMGYPKAIYSPSQKLFNFWRVEFLQKFEATKK